MEEDRGLAEQVFKRITSAYRVLSDARERKRYDLSLQRNEQYRESARDSESISLAEILAETDVYEHIFATDAMRELNATLQEIVSRNLIAEVGEQVVAVWPMTAAPAGNSHPGTFHAGAVVLTNVRLMLPFTYKWQECWRQTILPPSAELCFHRRLSYAATPATKSHLSWLVDFLAELIRRHCAPVCAISFSIRSCCFLHAEELSPVVLPRG